MKKFAISLISSALIATNILSTVAITNLNNPRQSFSLSNPSGTPTFSQSEISFQKSEGTRILNEIIAAANNFSLTQYVIPPGNYGFSQSMFKNATTNGFMLDGIKRPDNNPFTIKAQGVTFWFDTMNAPAPNWGRAVYINNCENIVLEGLTIDTYVRNAIEGKLTSIDIENNRIEIELLEGTFNDEAKILAYNDTVGTQCRIIPIKKNGNFIAPLYNINDTWGPEYLFITSISKSVAGRYYLTFRSNVLLNTIFTQNWLDAYGNNGTLEIGDGISLLYGVMGGFVVDNSKQITIKDSSCYIAKGMIFEDGGYGNHKWINVRMSPRPGTNQILGGGENMSQGLRVGSAYDNCYFGITSDDAINIHGFWGVVQNLNGNSVVLDRMPSGVETGDTVEFYNTDNGQLMYSYTVSSINGSADTDINGNLRNVTVLFTQAPNSSVFTSNASIWARFPTAECSGWVIKNCIFESNYQRILIQSGSGNFENNIINLMGSGLHLGSNFYSYEGGFINNVTIKGNTFLNSSLCPNSSPIYVDFINKAVQSQRNVDVSILNNLVVNSGGEAIKLKNSKNLTIDGNIFTNPLKYTALSFPSMPRAVTAISGDNVSEISITNNKLYETSSFTASNKFFNEAATLSNNQDYADSLDKISNYAFEAYAAQKDSKGIIDYLNAPPETISDNSTLNNLSIVGLPFSENFTKNALENLWSYDMNHFSIIENSDSIAGNSVKQVFSNASSGVIYAFDTKYKLSAGGTYKLTVSYKVLSDIFPSGMYFGFTRDGFLNQKNAQINFLGNEKNQVYTFSKLYTLDNYDDYYLQWFNLNFNDGSVIVIDTLTLEKLSTPSYILFNNYNEKNGLISGFSKGTTKKSFAQNIVLNDGITVKFFKGITELSDTSLVGTNTTLKVYNNGIVIGSYTTVLKGDINEDADITVSDLAIVKNSLLKKTSLSSIGNSAADFSNDGNLSIGDLIALKKLLLNH